MNAYLKNLPRQLQAQVMLGRDISRRLDMPAYLVGGFVRDLLTGKNNFDLDIAVQGNGIKFATLFAQTLGVKLTRHPRFGTATLQGTSYLKIDIATARKENYAAPAQLPEVTLGTMKDDLFRRDFTINAMAISISDSDFGTLLDCFGGRDDLSRRLIRVMHDASFIDDPTRILRAVRFEQRFDFKIEPHTLSLLKEAAKNGLIERVQPQRIRDELILMLKEKRPLKEIKRLWSLDALRFFGAQLSLSKNSFYFLGLLEKEIAWFEKHHVQRRRLDSWLLYLMGLLDSFDGAQSEAVCRTMAFRKGEEKRLMYTKQIPKRLVAELSRPGLKPSQAYDLLEPLSYEVMLFMKAKYKSRNLQRNITTFLKVYNGTKTNLSGDDLLLLGIVPGPDYRDIFQKVLHAKLNGYLKSKEDEVAFVKKILRRK